MNKGWIKLHRKILDCWFWDEKPYDRARAWVDLLLLANHDDKKISFDGKPITIKRGQYLTSILKLSDRWGWSRNKTKRFLDALECDGMITTDRTNKRTLVNVVNYGIYQDSETTDEPTDEPTDGQQKDNGRTTDEPQTRMNKNDKNEKKYYMDSRLNDAFADFVKMRKTIKKPMSDRAITMAKNNLEKLSNGDTDKAVIILEQSIYHCWQGLFELKDESFLERYRELKKAHEIIPEDPEEDDDEGWVQY